MPYCSTALKAVYPDQAVQLIAKTAIKQFNARDAYLLDNDSWNIDAGENDVRAINRNSDGVIQFFCRYANDVQRTEQKIKSFVEQHKSECHVFFSDKPYVQPNSNL